MNLLITLGLAFLEGLGIIISPCILPVLPILFATGLTGARYKPYGIMLGFLLAFCAFTLFARALVLATGVDLTLLRNVSFILLIVLAFVMMSNTLSALFAKLMSPLAAIGANIAKHNKEGGFWQGLWIGLPIGLIWTPCVGPLIASVILQTIQAQTNWHSVLTLFAFGLGVIIPILLLLLLGKHLLHQRAYLQSQAVTLRKMLGALLLLTVVLNMQGILYVSLGERKLSSQALQSKSLIDPLPQPYPAPAIAGISAWINSPALNLEQLRGKVVLLDFWTYSCINCLRTLPYLRAWYQQYQTQGLVIIGIHSPEFAFEQQLDNVQQAVKRLGILYPVALDNAFATWSNYNNRYWPAHYLINQQGQVVYTHFGEGQYAATEHNIQILLGKKTKIAQPLVQKPLLQLAITPETYLGSERSTGFAGIEIAPNTYRFPMLLPLNHWALQGHWSIEGQKIVSTGLGCAIRLHFQAQKVFLVLSSQDKTVKTASVLLNGKPMGKKLIIQTNGLYEVLQLPKNAEGILEIIFDEPGIEAYAFTFT
jgi:cytochrome c biogenesis protein CcdA/thiol-disulfide isomerase/thioredoxin